MKIQILDLAKQDLIEGYRFYEDMEAGPGRCLLTHLYTGIDSPGDLRNLHVFHPFALVMDDVF